jgi:hypothetical protein
VEESLKKLLEGEGLTAAVLDVCSRSELFLLEAGKTGGTVRWVDFDPFWVRCGEWIKRRLLRDESDSLYQQHLPFT